MIDVVIDEDCTAIVITRPNSIAAAPPLRARKALIDCSIRSATSAFMLLVMNANAKKMNNSPTTINNTPSRVPDAPVASTTDRTHLAGPLTAAWIGLLKVPPPRPTSLSVSHVAERASKWVVNSRGNSTATASRLK